jgi:hypothetical protein
MSAKTQLPIGAVLQLTPQERKRLLDEHQEQRSSYFAQHQLTELGDNEGPQGRVRTWHVGRPGGGPYWFHVMSTPFGFCMMGDFGGLVLKFSAGHSWGSPPTLDQFVENIWTLPAPARDREGWLRHIAINYAAMIVFLELYEANAVGAQEKDEHDGDPTSEDEGGQR